jgi:Skp family chaperone for outer membrane proteins
MNLLHPSPIFFFQDTPGLFDDVEMLQTDVMRFFAILCLCLMAVFALVKTLPMAPPDTGPAILDPADQKTEAELLQKKIAALKEKLGDLQSRLRAATVAAEHASDLAVKAAKTEETVRARMAKAKQELAKASQTLDDMRREIEVREFNLLQILEDIADKRQVRAGLKIQIENETQNLKRIRLKMEQLQDKLDQDHPPNPEPVKTPPGVTPPGVTPPAEPAPKGFTLQFASDEVLEKLISDGKVNFYAIAGKNVWRLKLSGGRPVYIAAEFPRQIYEMETPTVPLDYAAVFQRQIAAFGRRTVTWGVTLPGRMTASINQMVRDPKGGHLVIAANGEVKLTQMLHKQPGKE